MLLDLRNMRGAHDRLERRYEAAAFDSGREDYAVAGEVALVLDIRKDRDQYRLVGRVCTTLELSCSRCLDGFTRPVDLSFDLMYLPHSANRGEGDIKVEDDDLTTAYYRDDQIDLGQLMREQFYLALPMKPLCSEGCRGLCPTCGTNLNRDGCDCVPAWEDPRLAALRALLKNDAPGS